LLLSVRTAFSDKPEANGKESPIFGLSGSEWVFSQWLKTTRSNGLYRVMVCCYDVLMIASVGDCLLAKPAQTLDCFVLRYKTRNERAKIRAKPLLLLDKINGPEINGT